MASTYCPEPIKRTTELKPFSAIVLYSQDGSKEVTCATQHTIKKDMTLSIGTTVSADHLIDKVSKLKSANKNNHSQLLPSNLLLDTTENMVWHKPRFIADMWFRLSFKKQMQRLRVEWPPLLFCVDKASRSLSVYALGTNTRPTDKTRLYNAPFMNLDRNGRLCLGTSTLPKEFDYSSLSGCEETLINSQFTHTNHEYTFCRKTSDEAHFNFWREKSHKTKQPSRVQVRDLKPLMPLDELLRGLIQ